MSRSMERLVVFAGNTIEADLVRLHLQEAGLDATLEGDNTGTWAPYLATGGSAAAIRVSVPASDAERAAQIVEQIT